MRNIQESLLFILFCCLIGLGLSYVLLNPLDKLLINISLNGNMELWRYVHLSIKWNVAIIISRDYLSRFAYRIENYWWIFIVASMGSLLIALVSVNWQISKSAHINPVIELKKE